MENITISIFSLAKRNNGFFKSEKQAAFLISKMEQVGGFIGQADSGYNSCPISATWDNKGIIKIIKSARKGDEVMFERKIEGQLTILEEKEIKQLSRKIKSLQKEVDSRQDNFDSGNYNGSGDVSTYSEDMITRFEYYQNEKKNHIKALTERISEIK